VLKRLVLTPRRTWEIELTNGIRLVLDRRDTGKKIERFAEVYAQHLAAKAANVQLVDLRYANGFAVRWRSGSTEAGR
jgi:cell division protein FtsQ